MNIMLISNDTQLIDMARPLENESDINLEINNFNNDPLDIMASVCDRSPSIIIVDDDYLSPNSAHILKAIKNVKKNISIIFVTSDPGIELGRNVSQIGIEFYAFKPIFYSDLVRSLRSIINNKVKI